MLIYVSMNSSNTLLKGCYPIFPSAIGETYFKPELLRSWSGSGNQSISNFEKIRTVGKGMCLVLLLHDQWTILLEEVLLNFENFSLLCIAPPPPPPPIDFNINNIILRCLSVLLRSRKLRCKYQLTKSREKELRSNSLHLKCIYFYIFWRNYF